MCKMPTVNSLKNTKSYQLVIWDQQSLLDGQLDNGNTLSKKKCITIIENGENSCDSRVCSLGSREEETIVNNEHYDGIVR